MAFIPDDAEDRFSELSPSAERFYIYLCRHRMHRIEKSKGTLDECATKYKWSRSTKFGVQKELVEAGWIQKDGDYWLLLVGDFSPVNQSKKSDSQEEKQPFESKNLDQESKNLDQESKKIDSQSKKSDSHIRNTRINQNYNQNKSETSLDVELVFSHWQKELNHPKAKLDKTRRRFISEMLKEFSAEELQTAVSGVTKSPYHLGDNKQRTKFDDFKTIFRDVPQVEKFIGIYESYLTNGEQNGSSQNSNAGMGFRTAGDKRSDSVLSTRATIAKLRNAGKTEADEAGQRLLGDGDGTCIEISRSQ